MILFKQIRKLVFYTLYLAVPVRKSICMGQSKRQFGTRLKEHQKAVSTSNKGPTI